MAQYNAGPQTLGDGYFEALAKVKVDGEYIFKNASKQDRLAVGRMLLETAEREFPEATKTRKLLNEFAEAHQIAGKADIEVDTDLGFPFRQQYLKQETRVVELREPDGSVIKLNVSVDTEEVDWSKQNRAFAPNIIHAMDATHKSLVSNTLREKHGVTDFSQIHDSFGTHHGNEALLKDVTLNEFQNLYKGRNFIEELSKTFQKQGVALQRYKRNENGTKIRDKATGEFEIEDIPYEEITSQGDYDFKNFSELEYFFH